MKLTDILEFGISGFTVAKLLTVILMVLIGLALVKVLMRLIDKLFQKLRVSVTLLGILRAVIKVLLYFLLVVTVLHFLGIPVTSLIAAMSVVGVALSLGLQNFLGNVVGGVQMLVSQPFEVGDFVEAGGCSGVVQEIGLFYTKILTPDNKLVQEPNSAVVAANIINYTAEKTRRVDLTVTASGVLLGLGSGFFYALYSIFGRYALAHYGSMTVTVWTFLFAGPASLLLVKPAEMTAVLAQPKAWLLAAALVVFSTVLPYILYTAGLAKVEAGKASIMASLEPVVAALTGVVLFSEPMGMQTLLGILCVLAGVYILR